MKLSKKLLKEFYLTMLRMRAFEDKTKQLYLKGYIRGTIHVSQGQEAAAGAILAIEPDDYVLTTHRGHGHCIAKGVSSRKLLAEILGRETGCCNGRAGSLHAFDIEKGILGAAAVVGAGIPLATGVALGIQQKKEKKIVVNIFGDGASNQGTFHESVNLASTWNLPVVFYIENNLIADTTPFRETINIDNIAERAAGYGIPGIIVDGNSVTDVYRVVKKACKIAREGKGPSIIEAKTYRWEGHHIGDPCVWRKPGELEAWKAKCPIERLGRELSSKYGVEASELEALARQATDEIEDAARFAIESPLPDPATALDYVWGEEQGGM